MKFTLPSKRTVQLDETFFERFEETDAPPESGALVRITPGEENEHIDGMKDFLQFIHEDTRLFEMGQNISPILGYEIWYDGDTIEFYAYLEEPSYMRTFVDAFNDHFEVCNVDVDIQQPMPEMNQGEYIAGAELKLQHHFFEQIRNDESKTGFVRPYRHLLSHMVSAENTREMIQILFRSAEDDWTTSSFRDIDSYAEKLSQDKPPDTIVNIDNISFDDNRRRKKPKAYNSAVSEIREQERDRAFYITVRVAAISPDENTAEEQVDLLSRVFKNYYQSMTGQTFVPKHKRGSNLEWFFLDLYARRGAQLEWPKAKEFLTRQLKPYCETNILTIPELASLVYPPQKEEVSNTAEYINWESENLRGETIPEDFPSYEQLKKSNNS